MSNAWTATRTAAEMGGRSIIAGIEELMPIVDELRALSQAQVSAPLGQGSEPGCARDAISVAA
jgi:hypothetical protein